MSNLYADKQNIIFTYENIIVSCPNCNIQNIYNRVSDLKTIEPIDFLSINCLSCGVDFNINFDMIKEKHEFILFDIREAKKRKDYRYCILLIAQSLEAFLNHAILYAILHNPKENKILRGAQDLNQVSQSYHKEIKPLTFYPMRILFYQIYLYDKIFSNKEDIIDFIQNIKTRQLKNPKEIEENISNYPDKKKAELFLVLNKTKIPDIRNKIIHKFVYRPTLQEVEECLKDLETIIYDFDDYLGKYSEFIK